MKYIQNSHILPSAHNERAKNSWRWMFPCPAVMPDGDGDGDLRLTWPSVEESRLCSRRCDRNFYCRRLAAKKTSRIAKYMCKVRNKGSHVRNIAVWSDAWFPCRMASCSRELRLLSPTDARWDKNLAQLNHEIDKGEYQVVVLSRYLCE